jgi:hypothetical protein
MVEDPLHKIHHWAIMQKYEIIGIKVCEWIILINNRFKMAGVSMTEVGGKLCTDKKCYYNNEKR